MGGIFSDPICRSKILDCNAIWKISWGPNEVAICSVDLVGQSLTVIIPKLVTAELHP